MRSFLLDVNEGIFRELDVNNKLEEFYELLGCNYIDIVQRNIDGRVFDIVCDDEGLLKSHPVVSAIDSDHKPMLVGSLLFFHSNSRTGNLTGISADDCDHLRKHIAWFFAGSPTDEATPVMTKCDY